MPARLGQRHPRTPPQRTPRPTPSLQPTDNDATAAASPLPPNDIIRRLRPSQSAATPTLPPPLTTSSPAINHHLHHQHQFHHRHPTSKGDAISPPPAYFQGWWFHGELLRLSMTLLLHPTNLFLSLILHFCHTFTWPCPPCSICKGVIIQVLSRALRAYIILYYL